MSKRSTYKVAHAQKTLNMDKVYPAITKTSLDGGNQDAGPPPKKEVPLNSAGTQEDVVDPQDNVDQPDNAQAEAIGQLMVNVQQLQGVVGE